MTRFAPMGLLALLAACGPLEVQRDQPADAGDTPPVDIDQDNDGYVEGTDCDDTDPLVGPATAWYLDGDGDGHGLNGSMISACTQPDGYVSQGGDCDDENVEVSPAAEEVCNGIDDDCNGIDDDSSTNAWYLDYDTDGWGDPAYEYTDGCDGSTYLVSNSGDCDDLDPAVNPDATEVCDEIDNDCDATTDVGASDAGTWYEDLDGDGQGSDVTETACEPSDGFVDETGDCVDTDPRVFTGATEVCDGLNNDCDSAVDEVDGNPDVQTLWTDADTDGYGSDAAGSSTTCPAEGLVEQGGDCDDGDPAISPDADEICDGLDNDCDEVTDPETSLDASTWYTDADTDGYGASASPVVACDMPEGAVEDDSDCDDGEADVNPGEAEVCNDVDDDCDGAVDPSTSTDAGTWYPDSDGDSYGNASGTPVTQCDQPSNHVEDSSDCNDGDASSFPGATEYCDGADNDCDGSTDPDSSVDATAWYDDNDTDGFGGASAGTSCSAPSGTVADSSDCDDLDRTVHPGADEYCDTQDNDCDGDIDEEAGDTYYADADGDGYGDPAVPQEDCSDPDGFVEDASDCDDTNEYVNSDAIEVCSDELDNDCDNDTDSSPCVTEGDYSGNFSITLTETTYGLGSDSCEGTASLTVDTTANPMISGTVECAFTGAAATYLSGTYTGVVEGNFAQDISNYGTIDWSTFGWTLDFEGVYDADHEVNLDFAGDDTYEVYGIPLDFTYDGYVDTDVVP